MKSRLCVAVLRVRHYQQVRAEKHLLGRRIGDVVFTECMRAVAFGGNSARITTTNPAAVSCAFFGQARCDYSLDREACLARMAARYKSWVELLGGSVASRRQDCDDNAREADQMCLDELRECRASCD